MNRFVFRAPRVSRPAACLTITATLFIVIAIGATAIHRSAQHWRCVNNREWIGVAEEIYYEDHRHYVVGDAQELRKLGPIRGGRLPRCEAGGYYFVDMDKDGRIRIHCSVVAHDKMGDSRGLMLQSQMASGSRTATETLALK